jgi:hypothetical protein
MPGSKGGGRQPGAAGHKAQRAGKPPAYPMKGVAAPLAAAPREGQQDRHRSRIREEQHSDPALLLGRLAGASRLAGSLVSVGLTLEQLGDLARVPGFDQRFA